MNKSAEQLKLEDFWMSCYVAAVQAGKVLSAGDAADLALRKFKDRFPPAFTPIQDKQPD